MSNIFLYFAQAMSEGAVIIPNIIFSYLGYKDLSAFEFLLPFVLLYSFEKAGIFVLQSFGDIKNPLKILKSGMIIADVGAFISLFDFAYSIEISAVLIGFGLSFYMPFYRTFLDILKKENLWKFKNSAVKGYICLLIILLSIFFLRGKNINLVFLLFFIILIVTTYFIFTLPESSYLKNKPAFCGKISMENFLIFAVMLFLTFSSRALKQTANLIFIFYMAVSFLLFVMLYFLMKKPVFHIYSYKTIWYGAYRNFIIIYSLIYFIAVGKMKYLNLSYLMLAFGTMAAFLSGDKIKSFSDTKLILFAILSSFLMIFKKTYFLGIAVSVFFISNANKKAVSCYMKDDFFSLEEKRLIRYKFYNLGAVINQFFLLITITSLSFLLEKDPSYALNSYRLHIFDSGLENLFFITKLISIFILDAFGVILLKKCKNNND